ncbi:hypothetical protein BOX15_Mlig020889g2 [Macrostomum lignano]|uniref:Uncharacterized protein n=1 Tax=Macrostomum lignano TaxID=282301 RepID=A0A267GRE4_9PLAT|nr:hypothetical protein BOX15_Mlig020889g2 [Macrostomum lignano]
MEKAAEEDANQQQQLGSAELDQVQDYLRLHRAALRFEPGLVQEPGQLLALLDISPPAVRGLLVNALRCAGRLDLANRYDVERRIDAPLSTSASAARLTGRRRGQFALTVEVSAIQVCPADFGLFTAAAAGPVLVSTPAAGGDRPASCWISVEALNRSVDDLVSLAVGEDSRLCSTLTAAAAGRTDDSGGGCGCFGGCCSRLFRFPFSSRRRKRQRPAAAAAAAATPQMLTPQSVAASKKSMLSSSNRKYLAQHQQQLDGNDSLVAAADSAADGLLVRKARLLAEKSAELYQAVLADSEQRLVRYLEQDCGLLCLEAGSDPYCGLQIQLAATTADCLRRFLANLSSETVARRLEQLLLTDRLLAGLRLRRCRFRCCAPQCELALADLTG